tara:strand:- start:111 stop:248 length:138 start_codon:yes stop_codon:yes gene_type:complete
MNNGKIYCQLCKKVQLNTYWNKKGLTLCLDCKEKLERPSKELKAS